MENTIGKESGFSIKDIILIESSFSRINNVRFGEDVSNKLKISTEVSVSERTITVSEEVTLNQIYENEEQVKIAVKMVGIFECIGDTQLNDLEKFGKVNGAAIIFPFIREHISNLSVKAGVGAIIIPPVNFTENDFCQEAIESNE